MNQSNHSGPMNVNVDSLLPPAMAQKAEAVGVAKAQMGVLKLLTLAVLAGAFIALGAIFATTATAGAAGQLPFGVVKVLGGLVFSLGLILVIVGGAELFTGNNLIIMAWASGGVSVKQVLRNWVIVYLGNFLGSTATALLMYYTGQFQFGKGAVGLNALAIGNAKVQLGFGQAVALGIMCNVLVCLAVWLCFSARSTTDKILAIIFPITAFVAAGFEHCVANMYFIPKALLIKIMAPDTFWTAIGKTAEDYDQLTTSAFLFNNLVPVTLGNVIGGSIMVGLVYWFVYTRKTG